MPILCGGMELIMTRGFYALGSSMLTQNRTFSALSNNIANLQTPGFKRDTVVSTSFGDMVMNRVDSRNTPLGNVSMLRTVSETATIHSQGMLKPSERNLDFAIEGAGFFGIKPAQAEGQAAAQATVYTRNGSFNLDNEGYLILEGVGRVQGTNGDIQLGTDNFTIDSSGNIYSTAGEQLGTVALYDFADYGNIITVGEGMYSGTNGINPTLVENPVMSNKTIEGSNVDMGQEMTSSIATQRILQSVAQALKMYDATMQSATTQIGRIG